MCQFNKLHKYVSLLAVLLRGNEFKFFNEKKKERKKCDILPASANVFISHTLNKLV